MKTKTHDYREHILRRGHDIECTHLPGYSITTGIGLGVSPGDYIILGNPEAGETRYKVNKVTYQDDEIDKWFGVLVPAPIPLEKQGAVAAITDKSIIFSWGNLMTLLKGVFKP